MTTEVAKSPVQSAAPEKGVLANPFDRPSVAVTPIGKTASTAASEKKAADNLFSSPPVKLTPLVQKPVVPVIDEYSSTDSSSSSDADDIDQFAETVQQKKDATNKAPPAKQQGS